MLFPMQTPGFAKDSVDTIAMKGVEAAKVNCLYCPCLGAIKMITPAPPTHTHTNPINAHARMRASTRSPKAKETDSVQVQLLNAHARMRASTRSPKAKETDSVQVQLL